MMLNESRGAASQALRVMWREHVEPAGTARCEPASVGERLGRIVRLDRGVFVWVAEAWQVLSSPCSGSSCVPPPGRKERRGGCADVCPLPAGPPNPTGEPF
ncbi:hypothetical protein AAFF_G00246350 [Aldrovandia affinis]|uniref:Uncharacterized protein n=1 Tax=Aldrovandia affinis TaxID=143900 RepID=A0AAD7SV99_9TELE|nr:hypothetical protein AAFF_G00246350 [Aldrovandia affinis]